MTIQATPLDVTIVQGATLDEAWARSFFPYEVEWCGGELVKKGTTEPAPDADKVLEDYTDCTAEAQIRHSLTGALIATLNTTNGGIVLDGATLRLFMSYAATSALVYGLTPPAWQTAEAHVEVTRPDGTRERQYEITFNLDPESTV